MAPWVIQLIFPKVWMKNSTCGAGVDSMFSGKKRGTRAAWHRCWNGRHGGYSGCDGLSSMLGKASAPSVWLGESLKRYEKMLDYMDYALLVVIALRSHGLSVLIISIPFFIVFCRRVLGHNFHLGIYLSMYCSCVALSCFLCLLLCSCWSWMFMSNGKKNKCVLHCITINDRQRCWNMTSPWSLQTSHPIPKLLRCLDFLWSNFPFLRSEQRGKGCRSLAEASQSRWIQPVFF